MLQEGRRSRLRQRYDLTVQELIFLFALQRGRCAICGKDLKVVGKNEGAFNIDHCHTTQRIRGLLCPRCNMALGVKEDCAWNQKADTYLARFS